MDTSDAQELDRLVHLANRQQAGYEFEALVARLFRRNHFSVEPNARAAAPHQTDLFVHRADESYLIETKWRQSKADITDIDLLYVRLDSTPPSVVGVLVGFNGFAEPAIDRVRQRSDRPVLLVTGDEIRGLVDGRLDLIRLLRRKKKRLLIHKEVDVDHHVGGGATAVRRRPGELAAASKEFLLPDGQRTDVLPCGGTFGMFVFAHDLPDVDWVIGGGTGVTADVALSVGDETELLALIHELSNMGWATVDARWSIQQATTNWHGFGPKKFTDAIAGWMERYESLDDESLHHTEEFCYFDVCEGGLYTLTGDLAACDVRRVTRANLSFQLTGTPLDTVPLRHLCDTFDVEVPAYFRPMQESSMKHQHYPPNARPIVKPIAFVVEPDRWPGASDDRGEWVVGIVVKNPGHGQQATTTDDDDLRWLDAMLTNSGYLVCELRSHHPLSKPKQTYRLWQREWTTTSDALIVRPLAEWDDDKRTGFSMPKIDETEAESP